MKNTVIGVDFGTLSARAVAFDARTGEEKASAVFPYPHGCLDTALPDGTPVGIGECYQDPRDYEQALSRLFRSLFSQGVSPDDVIAVGTDFTFCTALPVFRDGTPLCCDERFRSRSQAYVKLWKHHGAQREADRINALAKERGESFRDWSGGIVSPEYMLPKIWETLRKDPEVFSSAAYVLEAGDWITRRLTGKTVRSGSMAGHRGLYRDGYPSEAFLEALDPRLKKIGTTLLAGEVRPAGTIAGTVDEAGARLTGLTEGTPVTVCQGDCYATLPAVGVTAPGTMAAVLGTSAVYMLLSEEYRPVPGSNGTVYNGMLEGYYGCESGQCCLGDHFSWFADTMIPASFAKEARERGLSVFALLGERASALKAGESGVLALDWFGGTRSVLMDGELTGLFVGCGLQTKPEELYRALIEATAYGARLILENDRAAGLAIDRFVAAGGVARKDPLVMQIFADVLGLEIEIAAAAECGALGSAVLALAAAGKERGGCGSLEEAVGRLVKPPVRVFRPDPESTAVYDRLYREYLALHDAFGRDPESPMKRALMIRKEVSR